MEHKEKATGWKCFDQDLKCLIHQFEIGETYEVSGELKMCYNGFHFHEDSSDICEFYSFSEDKTRVCEVECFDVISDKNKSVCRKIFIGNELTWGQVKKLVNTGKDNTGRKNSGYRNSGNMNSGNRNSGNMNSGYMNSGDMNSGNMNSGYRNSGNMNSGNRNSGNMNSGYMNSGDMNSGNMNSGYMNSGDMNSGNMNSGYRNSGNMNSGNRNSGDMNSGHMNSGDYNSCNFSSGFFNSKEQTIWMFNKDTGLKRNELNIPFIDLQINEWISESDMTDEQKKNDPEFCVKGGTLIKRSYKKAWELAWDKLSQDGRNLFLNLPNFDAAVFKEITGVEV